MTEQCEHRWMLEGYSEPDDQSKYHKVWLTCDVCGEIMLIKGWQSLDKPAKRARRRVKNA